MMPWTHRSTGEFVERASPSAMKERHPALDFVDANGKATSNAEWLFTYGAANVPAVPPKYRKIIGETLVPMTRAEQDAVDAAEVAARSANRRAAAKAQFADDVLLQAVAAAAGTTPEAVQAELDKVV